MPQEPMMKLKEALTLLVRIAALGDPGALRPGDRLNLIEDLRQYLDIGGRGEPGDPARQLDRADRQPAILKPVIEGVRALVDAVANGKRVELSYKRGKVVLDGAKLGGRDALMWHGDLRDEMIQSAAGDLAELEPGKLGRCPACQRPFLANRKGQRYCSHGCAVAVAVRRYQKRHRAERSQRERERRQRKKLNPTVSTQEVPDVEATRQR